MVNNDWGNRTEMRGQVQLSKYIHTLECKQTGDSVHMDHTKGVTRTEEWEGANGIGGGVEVGSGIGHGNVFGGENGDVTGDGGGIGAGTRTKWTQMKERQMGAGTGAGMGQERQRGRGCRPVEEHRMKMVTGTRTGSGRAEERRMSAINRSRLVDANRPVHSARVIISADRGWRLRALDSSVCNTRGLYMHIKPRG